MFVAVWTSAVFPLWSILHLRLIPALRSVLNSPKGWFRFPFVLFTCLALSRCLLSFSQLCLACLPSLSSFPCSSLASLLSPSFLFLFCPLLTFPLSLAAPLFFKLFVCPFSLFHSALSFLFCPYYPFLSVYLYVYIRY